MTKYLKSVKFPNSDTTYKIAEEQYNPDSEYAQSGKAVAEAIDPRTVYQKFIDDNNLKQRKWVDLSFVGGEYYYTDFLQAVADVNADTTVNSTTNSTNAVCQIFKNDEITVLRLLSDISFSSPTVITFIKSVIFDINGFKLTCSGLVKSGYIEDMDFIIYGIKANSTIELDRTRLFKDYTRRLYILGGNYISNNEKASTIFQFNNSAGKTDLEIYNANINMYSESTTVDNIAIYCDTTYPSTIKLVNTKCNVKSINRSLACGIYITNNTATGFEIEISNSNIIAVGKDNGDGSAVGIHNAGKANINIKNSKIHGITSGIQNNGTLYLQNCKCYSPYHGGVYNATNGFLYAENCEFHRSVCPDGYTPTGWAASYFGYSSTAYLNDCSFILDTEGDTSNGIAIKQGDTTEPTYVYMSNCELPKLRCDSGQYVYLGEGISDTIKNATVNGTKVLTDENYSTYINKETSQPIVDIEYEPTSRSPQSGIAVKKAINDATIEITNSEIDDICNTVIQPASEVLL